MSERIFVGDYNKKVFRELKLPDKVRIFDTSLRDGEQLPGVAYTKKEKIEIAEKLSDIGVDIIEAGFPINSQEEFETVKTIASMGLRSKICGLARVLEPDIKRCVDSGVDIIHVFVSTSDIHLKYQLNKTREEVKEMIKKGVRTVKDYGINCLFSAMDATRTELDFLIECFRIAEQEGADLINVPDTVGVMTPSSMRMLIGKIAQEVKVPIDVHCHNDFGLATANSLAGIEGGASGVQVSVNGNGERAGNASLEQVVMALECLYNVKTNIKKEKLTQLSRLVERYSEVYLAPHTPIVGKTAFAHESGIHAHAVLKHGSTFEPIAPEMVGQKSKIVIGKSSGKASIMWALKNLGFNDIPEQKLLRIVEKIKETAAVKKRIYDEDIVFIAKDELGREIDEETYKLEEISVITGNRITPSASVVITRKEGVFRGNAFGVGAVDAAANAIREALKEINIKLVSYNLNAITGGTDALADVNIVIEDEEGNSYTGNSVGEDIVITSVNAMMRAINKVKRRDHSKEM